MPEKFVDILAKLTSDDIAIDPKGRIVILNPKVQSAFAKLPADIPAEEVQGINIYQCNDGCSAQ